MVIQHDVLKIKSWFSISFEKWTINLFEKRFPGQVGIFRKSGVKSRIQALRRLNEASPDHLNYEGQSAYDVADMLKQYFRDLPEPVFTAKLTETFLQIYQCKPHTLTLIIQYKPVFIHWPNSQTHNLCSSVLVDVLVFTLVHYQSRWWFWRCTIVTLCSGPSCQRHPCASFIPCTCEIIFMLQPYVSVFLPTSVDSLLTYAWLSATSFQICFFLAFLGSGRHTAIFIYFFINRQC